MYNKEAVSQPIEAILEKARRWCGQQERCTYDLSLRLIQWGCPRQKVADILKQLTEEGFTDDRRFAGLFAEGKFHVLKWGKIKIAQELRRRKIEETSILLALENISQEEYETTLRKIIRRRQEILRGQDAGAMRQKIIRFLLSKGYETHLVYRLTGCDAVNTDTEQTYD